MITKFIDKIKKSNYLLIIFIICVFMLGVAWREVFNYIPGSNYFISDKNLKDPDIKRTISDGTKKKIVYVDSFHSEEPADLSIFNTFGMKAFVSNNDFVHNKEKLFQSGLLLMRYAIGIKEMNRAEYKVIRQYIANGGRILLLCPAWVWVSYDKKVLQSLPHYNIAKYFDLDITTEMVSSPLKIVNPAFQVKDIDLKKMKTAFSSITYDIAEPIIVGKDGKTAAVAAEKGNSKIIVWGQNNLLNDEFSITPQGKELTKRFFAWLLK